MARFGSVIPSSRARPPSLFGSALTFVALPILLGCATSTDLPRAATGEPVAVRLGEQMFHELQGVGRYEGRLRFFMHEDKAAQAPRIRADFCFDGELTGSRLPLRCNELTSANLVTAFVEEVATTALRRQIDEGTLRRGEPGGEIVLDLTGELERQGIFIRRGPWEGHRIVVLMNTAN